MTISDLKLLIKDLPDDMEVKTNRYDTYDDAYANIFNIGRDKLDKDEVLLIT